MNLQHIKVWSHNDIFFIWTGSISFDISVKENGEIQIYWQDLIIWGWLFPAYSPKEEFAS